MSISFSVCPGEKKKHRKELMAKKRRERMLNRGVDLEQVNLVSHFCAFFSFF